MTLEERFRYIMKLNNLSASAFADEIGVQRSSISHILSGRNKPSLEFIQKVLNRFPKVDASWLINGTTKVEGAVQAVPEVQEDDLEQSAALQEEEKAKYIATQQNADKRIKRIVVFYDDQSFEEFVPNASATN